MVSEQEIWRADAAHDYLDHIRRLGERVDALAEQIGIDRGRYEVLNGIDYSIPRVQSSPDDGQMVDLVSRIWGEIRDYTSRLAELVDERKRARAALDAMVDDFEASILRRRYINNVRWYVIRDDAGYSKRGMMYCRQRALAHFWYVMPGERRDEGIHAL